MKSTRIRSLRKLLNKGPKFLNRSLFRKLMATYLTVILLTLAILGLALSHLLGEYFFGIRERRLLSRGQEIVNLAREELANGRQEVLESLLEQIDASLQARIWIVDRQGVIVASSEARKTHWRGVRLDPEEINSVLAGQIVVQRGTTRRYGIPMISVGLPVRSNGRVIGAVIMNSPVAMVRSTIRQVEMLVLYAALVAVLLSALFGLVISRSISLPLRKMGKTALKMAEGDYHQKIEVASEDEIGQLGQALNHLAANLDQTISALYKQEKVRRDFVANVSHELRTPLTSIRGFVEPLIDGTVQDPQTKDRYLRIIREETERLKRLINDLLEMARLESEGIPVELVPLDISDVIVPVTGALQPVAEKKGVQLSHRFPAGLPRVLGDRDRLRQVVLNLVDNAIRFTPQGGRIIVEAQTAGQMVNIAVCDTGTGIAREDLPFIWDRFYKADKSHTPSEQGTGLGLSIVKLIVEAHGGQVNVESEPGKGSCFYFTLRQA